MVILWELTCAGIVISMVIIRKRGRMRRVKIVFVVITAVFILCAQMFALNKIRVKDMQWQIYKTAHFRIYYYKGGELLAKFTAVYAEEAYEHDTAIVNFRPKSVIPLFIYENHDDFTSTNITLSTLDEGTGGFTEPYKGRVVLPGTGSLKLLKQVITHEVAHAIQFGIIYGDGMRNYNVVYKELFLPTWVMEGLAEYSTDDMDSQGEMVLRDAIMNDRFMSIDRLDGFSYIQEPYLGYKEAQSFIMYMTKIYGKDFIPQFMRAVGEEFTAEGLFRKNGKKDFSDFKKEWETYMKKKYWTQAQGRDNPDKYGPQLSRSSHVSPVYDEGPAFSPDGSKIAFVSSRQAFRAIYIMRGDGKDIKQVFSGYDTISVTGFPISWASDNRTVYFAVSDKGKRYIIKGDTQTGATEKLDLKGMYDVYSPAVSPDDRYIAFIGSNGGFTDVYVYDTKDGSIENITDNVYENGYVNWSLDGKYLIFTEERDGYSRLALYDLKEGKKSFLTGDISYDCRYPRFINEKEIIYTSDKNGIFNLYSIDIKAKTEKQLTNIINGIFTPSYSPDGYIVYSYYEDACYNMYKYLLDRDRNFEKIPLVYDESLLQKKDSILSAITPQEKPEVTIKPSSGKDDEDFVSSTEKKAAKVIEGNEEYTTSLSPDLLFALAGYDSSSGFIGGGYASVSDMLGNHNLGLLADYVPGYYSQFELQYTYLALPFDVTVNGFYSQNVYELYDATQNVFFSQLDTREYGGSLELTYPLNLYTSISMLLETERVQNNYTNINNDPSVVFSGENSSDLINTAALILDYDHSAWRDLWPYSGETIMLYAGAADRVFGGTQTYNIYEADARKYFDLAFFPERNLNASFRITYAMTDGPDRPDFIFGGLNTVRGLDYGSLTGDKIGFMNSELRYSLVRNADFKLWPLSFIMIKNVKLALFDDAGFAKYGSLTPFDERDIVSGFGMSFVFDTFLFQDQYTPLRFELAKRTDISDDVLKFYFSISTGF
jgi:Tol biopolymer transport system component